MTYLLMDSRQQFQVEHTLVVETLHWKHPGAVWAIDHRQAPRPNDEPLASTSLGGGPDHHDNGMSVNGTTSERWAMFGDWGWKACDAYRSLLTRAVT